MEKIFQKFLVGCSAGEGNDLNIFCVAYGSAGGGGLVTQLAGIGGNPEAPVTELEHH